MSDKPLCFVLMPFGPKHDPAGGPDIDFDPIYQEAIKPAIEDAGMEPIRADEERTGGIIHKPMFERLMLCDYAVADLTTGNANVFYELGVRHAARPATTLTIFARHQPIPFDINFLRSLPYTLGKDNSFGSEEAKALRAAVANRLADMRELAIDEAPTDSPIFQLIGEWQPGDLARLKTDVFRDRVRFSEEIKERTAGARSRGKDGVEELSEIERKLENLDGVEAGVIVDLFLSHRALSDWDGMIGLYDRMPEVLRRQVLVREQLGFALNRRAGRDRNHDDRRRALQILEDVESEQGASSETCGLVGRIYKDMWQEAASADDPAAEGLLRKAIDAYLRGFKADWRDAYPGINAVTLLDISGAEASLTKKDELVPVVRFSVLRRLEGRSPDYWDHATMLELSVLAVDEDAAKHHLADALAAVQENWEPETTANNLRMIKEARDARSAETPWLADVIAALEKRAGSGT